MFRYKLKDFIAQKTVEMNGAVSQKQKEADKFCLMTRFWSFRSLYRKLKIIITSLVILSGLSIKISLLFRVVLLQHLKRETSTARAKRIKICLDIGTNITRA